MICKRKAIQSVAIPDLVGDFWWIARQKPDLHIISSQLVYVVT